MNWLIKTLGSAVVAGIGWKIGIDVYESAKASVKQRATAVAEAENDDEVVAEDGAAASQTDVVDLDEAPPNNAYRW